MKVALSLLALSLLFPMLPVSANGQDKPPTRSEVLTYRLNYTVTETDAGKKVGVQHYSQTENPGGSNSMLKLGSKIPIAAMGSDQFTYLDIGLNITSRLVEQGGGLQVFAVVEQTNLVDSPGGRTDRPIIRQARLESTAVLPLGKAVVLGSVDIPGSTRHLEVEVLLERVS